MLAIGELESCVTLSSIANNMHVDYQQ